MPELLSEHDRAATRFDGPVPFRRRLQISAALGLLAGLRAFLSGTLIAVPRDFAQIWYAARAMLAGQDPYALVGPGRAFEWEWPLFYPLPAAVAVIPLTPLSATWAGAVFMTLAGGCFAWALMEHGYRPLIGFMGAAMVLAAEVVQWSPLLAAAVVLPPLAFFSIAKPTIGAALFFARPSWWAVGGALVLGTIAFAFQADWVTSWRSGFDPGRLAEGRGLHFRAPVMLPGGFLALAALLRWRRPEARLIAALACVPQTMVMYEALPLFLVPRTLFESGLMVVLSFVGQLIILATTKGTGAPLGAGGVWIVLLLYLPATIMVLGRPNEGLLPAWLERAVARGPEWLRGRAPQLA